jgi:hypothetical protein
MKPQAPVGPDLSAAVGPLYSAEHNDSDAHHDQGEAIEFHGVGSTGPIAGAAHDEVEDGEDRGRRAQQAPPAVEQDTSPLTETVVPPRVVLPRTFTERSGYSGPLGLLLFAGAFGYLQQGLPAALRWGALVCASALALSAWFSAKTRRITCTEQGITVSTHYRGHSFPKATFAVETSEGTAVRISDRRSRYFEEFVAICNAHTPQLPYIWEHRQRPPFRHQMRFPSGSMSFGRVRSMDEVWPPDYFQVARDRGAP